MTGNGGVDTKDQSNMEEGKDTDRGRVICLHKLKALTNF